MRMLESQQLHKSKKEKVCFINKQNKKKYGKTQKSINSIPSINSIALLQAIFNIITENVRGKDAQLVLNPFFPL